MSINILEMVKGAITEDTTGQIGQLLGEDKSKTSSAISSALPSILGGLMKQSSTNSGATDLFNTVKGFDSGLFGNIAGALGGGRHTSLIQTGMGLLGSIFGGNQSGLIGTIARMAGIGQNSAGSLLGILAPIVMSALSGLRSKDNLDSNGLANLLATQKDHVARELPNELRSELGMDSFLNTNEGVRTQAHDRTRATTTEEPRRSGGGLLGKLLPLAALAIVGWLGYQYLMPGTDTEVASDKASTVNEVDASKIDVDQLTGKMTTSMDELTSSIGGITDEASAKSAVETITGATESLGGLNLDSLTGDAKSAIGGAASPLLDKLKAALETAYAIPGVKAIIEPIVSPLLGTLSGIIA
jgi:hypothetical protein